ncbi:MAG: IS4 family transposase [Clostridiaceae bacterium]|nr:IS4 family transposase [Clostridiaceae bacterium]
MVDYIKLFDKFIELINWETLQYSSFKLNTDYKISRFFTSDHLKTMIYYHIGQKDGLRDTNDCGSMSLRLKEIVKSVSLSTLSYHNKNRNFEVFLPVMNELINKALNTVSVNETLKQFGPVKLIDSTTISMCLAFYEWALFRKTKSGVKIHTKIDLNRGIPECFTVTNAADHDRTQMDALMNEKHCTYVFDKGYVDYKKFDEFTAGEKYFITRIKDNSIIQTIKELKPTYSEKTLLDTGTKIIYDKIVKLGNPATYQTKNEYRIIRIIDSTGKELTFVTNIDDLFSEEIAWLYKKRWEIELFFKWIKQNLKFKTLIGHSLNAVMIQIITGIMTFVMLKLVETLAPIGFGILAIKRALKTNLLEEFDKNNFSWSMMFNTS